MNDAISRSALIEILSRNSITSIVTVQDKTIMQHIEDAPALDVQPVVHASLTETGFDEAWCNWGDCTHCGTSNILHSKYCNECGARMDGDPHGSGQ